ncbi:type III pantothenate kinase [Sulfurimonas sp. NWX79]|uniref:type III pantothenate kinase n=1 Tax=Sulfurimonas sp. NWX79 TaxID=2925412 RepID=UPI0032047555
MLLCDIGNTSYHFLKGDKEFKKDVDTFDPSTIKERTYYISVNKAVSQKLHLLENWIDLSSFIDWEKYYETMGVDRIFAIEAVENGIIIDAGSAITVDVVHNGAFEGGFIYPGLKAIELAYKNISPVLETTINFELDMSCLPKNTHNAISYAYLKPLRDEVLSHNLPIILTGGDASQLKKIFPEAKVETKLIFTSMQKIIASKN